MDREYIKLCAEMAYNDVIMESILNEEYDMLNEGAIIDRIRAVFNNIINYIKQLYDKIISFFKNKINALKNTKADSKDSISIKQQKLAFEFEEYCSKGLKQLVYDINDYNRDMRDNIIRKIQNFGSKSDNTVASEIKDIVDGYKFRKDNDKYIHPDQIEDKYDSLCGKYGLDSRVKYILISDSAKELLKNSIEKAGNNYNALRTTLESSEKIIISNLSMHNYDDRSRSFNQIMHFIDNWFKDLGFYQSNMNTYIHCINKLV